MEYAGLIENKQYEHGPDMPMDAKLISRLPWSVMKRVIGDRDGAERLDEVLCRNFPPGENQRWKLYEWINAKIATFHLVEKSKDIPCQDCDGEGSIYIGRHYYDCKECYGSGIEGEQGEMLIAERHITWDGMILNGPPLT